MGLLTLWACGSNPFSSVEGVDPQKAPKPGQVDTAPTDTAEDSPVPPVDFDVCINELMAVNVNSAADENGIPSDWIELHNPGATALDLGGWSIARDDHVDPLDGLSIDAGGFLLLWADDSEVVGGGHLDFGLPSDGGTLVLTAPDGQSRSLAFGSVEADWSAARGHDCAEDEWDFVWHGTPGSTNHPPTYTDVPLVATGDLWRYLDTGVDPDPSWTQATFDDSAWLEGPSPLGFGDVYQVTVTSYGPDANNKYVTTWFRRRVSLSDVASLAKLTLSVQRDDGAAVYLNGVEVARSNLPEGALTSATLATASTDAETAWWDFELDPALLVEGDNVLAAEVHQASVSSSDLGFDLHLTGAVQDP